MAFALFNFLTNILLKVLGEDMKKAIENWFPSFNNKQKGCLQDQRLQIAQLVKKDKSNKEVHKLYKDEVNTHGTEGAAINCLSVIKSFSYLKCLY